MSPFQIGMLADTVLTIEKKSGRIRVAQNNKIGENEFGLMVQWFFQDCTLLLARMKKHSPYVVVEIQPILPRLQWTPMSAKKAGLSVDDILNTGRLM